MRPVSIAHPLAVGLLATLLLGATPSPPVTLAPSDLQAWREALEKDRAETQKWLQGGATSYLATVFRKDFGNRRSLTVGSAADCDVRLEDPEVLAHHLRVTVSGDSFRVDALDPGAWVPVGDERKSQATLGPSTLPMGRFKLRLSHQRFPAQIVFDPQSPRLKQYKGLQYFAPDPSVRFVLALTPDPSPDTVVILSTRGNARRAVRAGWFDFKVGRATCRLEATRLLEPGVGESDVGVFFRDATTGRETYGLGRYVDPTRQPDGRYVLDFNYAYNPACAFSEHYNCPIPPRGNRLKVAIRAGEKDSHYLVSDSPH